MSNIKSIALKFVGIIFLPLSIVYLASCVTSPEVPEAEAVAMVPEPSGKAYTPSNRSLRINSVRGFIVETVSAWQVAVPSLDNNQFQQTLIASLRQSNIFNRVSTDIAADYSLSAKLVGQQGIDVRSLLVRYTLVESATGKVLWQENVLSQDFVSTSEVLDGSKRARLVLKHVVQKNLAVLLEKLNVVLQGVASESVVTPMPEPLVEPEPPRIEPQVEPVVSYPRKLAGPELAEHFKRYKRLTFYKTPGLKFTISVEPGGYLVRHCPMCRTTEGAGDINIKTEHDLVCLSWSFVTYPSSSCFELIQLGEKRYQLVDPVDGETYAYTAK